MFCSKLWFQSSFICGLSEPSPPHPRGGWWHKASRREWVSWGSLTWPQDVGAGKSHHVRTFPGGENLVHFAFHKISQDTGDEPLLWSKNNLSKGLLWMTLHLGNVCLKGKKSCSSWFWGGREISLLKWIWAVIKEVGVSLPPPRPKKRVGREPPEELSPGLTESKLVPLTTQNANKRRHKVLGPGKWLYSESQQVEKIAGVSWRTMLP